MESNSFAPLFEAMLDLAVGIASLIGGLSALGVVFLALLNVWGILSPADAERVMRGLIEFGLLAALCGAIAVIPTFLEETLVPFK